MKTALLISTYNWVKALELIFESILKQTEYPDEILIADDGSNTETKQLIVEFSKRTQIPILHFWQEDKGFRKAKILNIAIANSNSDYIIQIDGDCIIQKSFIEDHKKYAKKGVYLYGSRVNILPKYVDAIFESKAISFTIFSNKIKNKTRALHVPFLSRFYKPHINISQKFRGCNVSFWTEDVILVNGYNEDFEGWGREDSDLVIRMGNNGILSKRLRYAGIVYHIYHKVNSKNNLKINNELQNKALTEQLIRCKNGIDKYIDEREQ